MQSGSTRSRTEVLAKTAGVLEDGGDATALGNDLFALARALDGTRSLRRALTEPAVPAAAKGRLLRSLFGERLGDAALDVAEVAVGQRWSSTLDLPDVLEQASVAAHVAKADTDGHLDDLEDSLFRFSRIVDANPPLRDVLTNSSAPYDGKKALVADLLGDKVDQSTATLLAQAVAGRHRSLTSVLGVYQKVAADRRDSMVATVWVAAPLDEQQHDRLAAALSAQHDKQVHLNVVIDPDVLGGVRVAVGDEVLDSTVETRLRQAQRRLER